MEFEKLCRTCKYENLSCNEEPCKSCECKSNWIDANWTESLTIGTTINTTVSTREFKMGDLVTVGYSKDIYVYLCNNFIIRVPYDVTIDYVMHLVTYSYSISDGIDILKTNTNDFTKFATRAVMDRVQYATATEIKAHNATAPKVHPVFLGEWIQKRKVNNMEEKKLCINCKYVPVRYNEEPCKSCRNKSNWVHKSKPDKFKVGDLVVEKDDPMSIKTIYIYFGDNWVLRVPNYVAVRSECDYVFSTYKDELIAADIAIVLGVYNLEYASPEDITAHDRRAKIYYIVETLNEWFGQLMKKKPEKKHHERTNITYNYKVKIKESAMSNLIKKVIFSDPATIIFWEDGTKTVVKTQDGEKYDKEKGFAMAVCKKIFGNERDYYNVFKRWMRKGEERHEET